MYTLCKAEITNTFILTHSLLYNRLVLLLGLFLSCVCGLIVVKVIGQLNSATPHALYLCFICSCVSVVSFEPQLMLLLYFYLLCVCGLELVIKVIGQLSLDGFNLLCLCWFQFFEALWRLSIMCMWVRGINKSYWIVQQLLPECN